MRRRAPDVGVAAAAAAAVLAAACGTPAQPRGPMPTDVLNRAVTPENVESTICRSDFVAALKLSPTELRERERNLMLRTGTDPELAATFVVAEMVPAALGGDPRKPKNLQPLPLRGAANGANKDRLDRRLHFLVCTGKLGLREAQSALWNDWYGAYVQYVPESE